MALQGIKAATFSCILEMAGSFEINVLLSSEEIEWSGGIGEKPSQV